MMATNGLSTNGSSGPANTGQISTSGMTAVPASGTAANGAIGSPTTPPPGAPNTSSTPNTSANPAPAITTNPGATSGAVTGNVGQTTAPTMNSGLLANAMSSSPSVGFNDTTTTNATAAQNKVTDPSLVQNQLSGILASNSPLMQQAQLTADQQSQSRGLVNSTIGQAAGTQAMLAAALPIAQQDASTNAQSSVLNTQNQQQANLANQSADLQTKQFNAQGNLTAQTTTANFVNSNVGQQFTQAANVAINNANNADKNAIQSTVNATQLQLANLQNSFGVLTQTNTAASSAWNGANSQIQTILADTSLTPTAMNSQISSIMQNLTVQMGTINAIDGVNIASTISNPFGTTTYGATPSNPGTAPKK